LNPSPFVILSVAKNFMPLRVNSVKGEQSQREEKMVLLVSTVGKSEAGKTELIGSSVGKFKK